MKTILHLCADLGSDSYPFQIDPEYNVIRIGEDPGVENYSYDGEVWGVIANPPCTEFSGLHSFNSYKREPDTTILNHCLRIIKETKPAWYVIENPATGTMREVLGKPNYVYQPWWYGSPWTKKTALWGKFSIPDKIFENWEDVPKNDNLYIRPNRVKPGFNFFHKSAIHYIDEFKPFMDSVKNDADLRSLCSQGFARAFKLAQEKAYSDDFILELVGEPI